MSGIELTHSQEIQPLTRRRSSTALHERDDDDDLFPTSTLFSPPSDTSARYSPLDLDYNLNDINYDINDYDLDDDTCVVGAMSD